jgi:hypothetical protein
MFLGTTAHYELRTTATCAQIAEHPVHDTMFVCNLKRASSENSIIKVTRTQEHNFLFFLESFVFTMSILWAYGFKHFSVLASTTHVRKHNIISILQFSLILFTTM